MAGRNNHEPVVASHRRIRGGLRATCLVLGGLGLGTGVAHAAWPWESSSIGSDRTAAEDSLSKIIAVGRQCQGRGNSDGARKAYQQARRLLHKRGDRAGEARVLLELGRLEGSVGHQREATAAYEQAQRVFAIAVDKGDLAAFLSGQGSLQVTLGLLDHARWSFGEALKLFALKGDQLGEAGALKGMGDLERHLGRNDESRAKYEKALSLFRAHQHVLGEAGVLLGLGRLESVAGNHEQARKDFTDAMRLYRAEGSGFGAAEAAIDLGDLDAKLGRNDEALEAYDGARQFYHLNNLRLGEANALKGLGHLYGPLGRSDDARRAYGLAQRMYQDVGSRLGEANVLRGLGDLEQVCGNYSEARSAFQRARELYKSIPDPLGEANALRGLGDVDVAVGSDDDARRHYEDARTLYRTQADSLGEANVLVGLGELEGRIGRLEEAWIACTEARTLYKTLGTPMGEGNALMCVGDTERKRGRTGQARTAYRDAAIQFGLAGVRQRQLAAESLAAGEWSTNGHSVKRLLPLVGLAIAALIYVVIWRRRSRQTSRSPCAATDTADGWFANPDADTVFVFIHGILSSSATCWRAPNGVFWPALVRDDPRFGSPGIFLAGYYTEMASGAYRVSDAAAAVMSTLRSDDTASRAAPLSRANLIFVAHSTGGLVARAILDRYVDEFIEKSVGLVLLASPSRGSTWANRLRWLQVAVENRMATQLMRGNDYLQDLDGRFADLVHQRKIPRLAGIDLFENHFVYRLLILRFRRVVDPDDSSSYFGAPRIVPNTDHASIAKPRSVDDASHQFLWEFFDVRYRPLLQIVGGTRK
jgi:tetratricopeptide (TPR) repeat protein